EGREAGHRARAVAVRGAVARQEDSVRLAELLAHELVRDVDARDRHGLGRARLVHSPPPGLSGAGAGGRGWLAPDAEPCEAYPGERPAARARSSSSRTMAASLSAMSTVASWTKRSSGARIRLRRRATGPRKDPAAFASPASTPA